MHDTDGRLDRRTFLRSSAVTAIAGIALFDLAACGSSDSGSSSGSTGSAGAYTGDFSVPLYKQLPDNAPFIVGLAKGFFTDEQLTMKPVDFTQGTDVIRSVSSQTHLGSSSPISGIVAHESGFPDLRIVGTCLGRSTIVYLVPPDSSIKTLKDLDGKKVGVNAPTSITTYLGQRMVESVGLKPGEDVELINVKGVSDAATAMDNGVVDCAWSSPPLSVQLIQEGRARLLYDTAQLVPKFIQTSLFSDTSFIESKGDVVRRWLKAIATSQQFIRDNTEEAAQIWGKELGIDHKIAVGTLKTLAPGFEIAVDKAAYQANVEACQALGLVKGDVPYDEIVDTQFLPQAAG